MRFSHISYEKTTGAHSKRIESYNFHKAAAVLAEYGFDCVRLADDWKGADFLAFYKSDDGRDSDRQLRVQLKSCLVIDQKYEGDDDLYICFPVDGTCNWYLIKHSELYRLVEQNAPNAFNTKRWQNQGNYFSHGTNKSMRKALEPFAYRSSYPHFGYRECAKNVKRGADRPKGGREGGGIGA